MDDELIMLIAPGDVDVVAQETMKNEEINIPNSVLMGSITKNYSRLSSSRSRRNSPLQGVMNFRNRPRVETRTLKPSRGVAA